MRKFKIGVYGSAAGELTKIIPKAHALGEALGRNKDKLIVITGASIGLPYEVVQICAQAGVEIWGYSNSLNLSGQEARFPVVDTALFNKLIYVSKDFEFADNDRVRLKYRNVISTANCDAGIIVSGRWGTINEFTNLIDTQKVVGVLTGTGGFADELPALTKKISKEGQGKIIFESNPAKLVSKLLQTLKA